MGVSKTTDHIQTEMKMQISSQEPPASSKAQTQDMGVSKTSDYIQIKIKMPNPSQKHPASAKAPNHGCYLPLQNQGRDPKFGSWLYQRPVTYPNQDQDAELQSGASSILQSPNQDFKDMDFLCTFKIRIESQNLDHGVSKTSDHIQIQIKMPNPSQEPSASSKAPNKDLKDMDVLCTFKIKIYSQNLDQGCINKSDHIKIKIMMPNPRQEPPASSKPPNE